jgi:hypothetical protein
MRKSILAAATAVVATFSSARADQVTDTILAIDVVLHQIMLSNGEVYSVPKSVPISKLAIGSKVKVTYTSSNGINAASAVTRMK